MVMKEKVFKECAPVYDEECSTTYDKHCKVNKKCVEIYQTVCHKSGGYSQTCSQVPAQTCYPETVCHKTPQTKCYQTRSQKCSKVIRSVPVEQQSHQCLPFPNVSRPQPVITPDICSAKHQSGGHSDSTGGYIPPQGLSNHINQGPDNIINHGYGAPDGGLSFHNDGYGAPVSGVDNFNNDGYGAPLSGVDNFNNDGYGAPVSGGASYGNDGYGAPVSTYNNDGYGSRLSNQLTPDNYASPSSISGLGGLIPAAQRRAEEGVVSAINTVRQAGEAVMALFPGVANSHTNRRHKHQEQDYGEWMPINRPYNK